MQDLMVSDIARIEVIRGPGGAVWGANAVNGVINVITRPAAETQGLSVSASAGTFERGRAGIRYGGTLGAVSYRVFSQWSGQAAASDGGKSAFDDGWHSLFSPPACLAGRGLTFDGDSRLDGAQRLIA